MSIEEINKLQFRYVGHLSSENEHITAYSTDDGRFGWFDHVPVRDGMPHGRMFRHYRIDKKTYKSKQGFIKALENLNANNFEYEQGATD